MPIPLVNPPPFYHGKTRAKRVVVEYAKTIKDHSITNPKTFFDLVAAKLGTSPKTVERYYFTMVQVIIELLRKNGLVRLKGLGDFFLYLWTASAHGKAKIAFGKYFVPNPKSFYVIRFMANKKLKIYFKAISETIKTERHVNDGTPIDDNN
jgi:hypothetical protein